MKLRLHLILRLACFARLNQSTRYRRQRLHIKLAANHEGKLIELHKMLRNHVHRQKLLQMLPQLPARNGAGCCIIRNQYLFLLGILPGTDHRLFNGGMSIELLLDLRQLHAVAADFHLEICSSQIFNRTLFRPLGYISRTIDSFTRTVRILNEPLVRQLRIVLIPPHNTVTADIQEAGNTYGLKQKLIIENINLCIPDRLADIYGTCRHLLCR
ncbi:hypothetical protein D3C73_524560 [compost metagenome]